MKKAKIKIPSNSLPLVLFVLVGCILAYVIYLRVNAVSMGKNMGSSMGSLAGKAVGSVEGMTKGRIKGNEEGKKAGLSAEDTVAEVANKMRQIENLQVLVASVKLRDFHSIGDNVAYAALYLAKGDYVFTIDLSEAVIRIGDNELIIELPNPEGTLYIDESSVNKIAEYQRKWFNGSAEDGYNAYLNTRKKLQEASEETLDNYEELFAAAKDAGEKQVTRLAQTVGTFSNVSVIWKEGE